MKFNNELKVLEPLARKEPLTRTSTFNGVVEYTVLNYAKEECVSRLQWVKETLSGLQIAIDRANLTNMIDVE